MSTTLLLGSKIVCTDAITSAKTGYAQKDGEGTSTNTDQRKAKKQKTS